MLYLCHHADAEAWLTGTTSFPVQGVTTVSMLCMVSCTVAECMHIAHIHFITPFIKSILSQFTIADPITLIFVRTTCTIRNMQDTLTLQHYDIYHTHTLVYQLRLGSSVHS